MCTMTDLALGRHLHFLTYLVTKIVHASADAVRLLWALPSGSESWGAISNSHLGQGSLWDRQIRFADLWHLGTAFHPGLSSACDWYPVRHQPRHQPRHQQLQCWGHRKAKGGRPLPSRPLAA